MRILVIKIGAIGDVLMATPAMRALRRAHPKAQLDVLVGRSCEAVLRANPHLSSLLPLDDARLYHGGIAGRMRATLDALRIGRHGRYDLVFVFQRDWRFNLLARAMRIPTRVGFDRRGEGIGLTHRLPVDPRMHQIEQYLALVGLAGVAADGVRMDFNIAADAAASAATLLTKNGVDSRDDVVALAPGGGRNARLDMPSKRWPTASYQALAGLIRASGRPVVLVGAPSDRPFADPLESGDGAPVANLVGLTSLAETAAVLQRCRLLIANDTGPSHLAEAVGTPALVVFGPTPPHDTRPLTGHSAHLWEGADLPCSPCYRDGRFPDCPIQLECMRRITPQRVWEEAQRMLARSASPTE